MRSIAEKINELSLDIVNDENIINKDEVIKTFELIKRILFPGFFHKKNTIKCVECISKELSKVHKKLNRIISLTNGEESERIVNSFFNQLPEIKKSLNHDLEAFLKGDPAAESAQEVILTYPGYNAIIHHRVAHLLLKLNVKKLPRIIAEHAHEITSIDIHPGAIIGDYFFIDHGTGVVIGETAVIGEKCTIYQGVTLGAISLRKGAALKGIKRHPTLLNNVTVYSGASILGDRTIIGNNCVIGSNVFITKSVEDNVMVILNSLDIVKKENKQD